MSRRSRAELVLVVAVVSGLGSGSASAVMTEFGASQSAPSPVGGDFDGDGFGDLAVGAPGENAGAGAVHVLYGAPSGLGASRSQFFTQDSPGIVDVEEPGDGFGAALAAGDVDDDGRADLAIGAPAETLTRNGFTRENVGAVHLLRGSASGLAGPGSELWSEFTPGVEGRSPTPGDHFGAALAIGRGAFISSPRVVLAIGAPGDTNRDGEDDAGAVFTLPGDADGGGLTTSGSTRFDQDRVPGGQAEAGDRFGASLTIGNVGNLAGADLGVGVPGENAGAGAVQVIYRSFDASVWTQSSAGVAGVSAPGEHFGTAVAIEDLGGSAEGDLVIGVPDESTGGLAGHGAVHVLRGHVDDGTVSAGQQYWTQDSPGVAGAAEAGDRFGASVATGNTGGSARTDLAIGVPGENTGAGVAQLLFGTDSGVTGTGSQFWSQDTRRVAGVAEPGDGFGASLAIADFGGTAQRELAIAAPGEDTGAGVLHVLPGAPGGLTATGSQLWSQDSPGIAGVAEPGDRFAAGLGK